MAAPGTRGTRNGELQNVELRTSEFCWWLLPWSLLSAWGVSLFFIQFHFCYRENTLMEARQFLCTLSRLNGSIFTSHWRVKANLFVTEDFLSSARVHRRIWSRVSQQLRQNCRKQSGFSVLWRIHSLGTQLDYRPCTTTGTLPGCESRLMLVNNKFIYFVVCVAIHNHPEPKISLYFWYVIMKD